MSLSVNVSVECYVAAKCEAHKAMITRVVVIEFWHSFSDYNYLSLNLQLIPTAITKVAYE